MWHHNQNHLTLLKITIINLWSKKKGKTQPYKAGKIHWKETQCYQYCWVKLAGSREENGPIAMDSVFISMLTYSTPLWWDGTNPFITKALWFRPDTYQNHIIKGDMPKGVKTR